MSIKTANIRAVKDKLSAYLRDVQHGDIVLVTDRGKVVAEIRQPTLGAHAIDSVGERKQRLIDAGVLTTGVANAPALYRDTGVHLPAGGVDDLLGWTRGEK